MDLHGQIMNLPQTPGLPMVNASVPQLLAYKMGHRDARHAAAELALKADAERDELLELLRKARDELSGLPRSLGYEYTHLREIDAVLARHVFAAG